LSKQFRRYGILFVVSAPSGAGKTTRRSASWRFDLFLQIDAPRRQPRAGRQAFDFFPTRFRGAE
jgi:guanylate kinase